MSLDGQIVSTSYSDLFVVYIDPANKQQNMTSLSFFVHPSALSLCHPSA
ncbi:MULTISPECIES: hypothetical protein [unclassified Wolbachia]|nr:hypothetical protein [Wolbachia endosymbiont (group A) of Apoderus coryli]